LSKLINGVEKLEKFMSNILNLKGVKLFAIIVLAAAILATFGMVAVQSASADCAIVNTLRVGSRGDQVKCLQDGLGGLVSDGAFGPKTKAAVVAWQASKGLVADGVFGPKSNAAWTGGAVSGNFPAGCASASGYSSTTGMACYALPSSGLPAGCSSTVGFSPTTGVACSTTSTVTYPAGCSSAAGFSSTTGQACSGTGTVVNTSGVAAVALAADNPASGTVPDAANANFTKFTISAGPTAVSITSLYVTRYGLSINSDVENIKILDGDMVALSSSGSLNTNNKAQITFSPALTIPANTVKAFYIRAGIVNNTTAGKSVALGIDSASDVIANVTVGGSFPVKGNLMNTVLLDIGVLTADEDGTVTDSQPDGGDTDVVVNKFKLTSGSVEAVTVKQIAVERQGTASSSDIANIELWDVSKAVTLGTAASWDANGLATFNNLNIVLDKGETRRFEIRVDIVSGSSLTINADLTDGSDVRVQAVGNTYGFYITPTNSLTNGQGASNQTIQAGTLTVTKSSSTPAAGNISSGSDISLAVFDFQVLGESMKITSVNVDTTLGTMTYDQVTNVKLVDATTGALLAGPKDLVVTTEDVTFTDVIILPVGVTKVKVTANLASDVSLADSIKIDLDAPSTGIVAKGMTSNDSVTPSPTSAVSGNTMVVQAAALTAVTNTTPAARSIVKGQQDFIFATATLSAANSGEDVNVSTIVVENTVDELDTTTASGAQDVDNVEIWADLTSALSARGDVYETKIGDTKQFTGTADGDAVLTFNLNPIVSVTKNGSVNIAIIADLSASATTGDTFAISIDTDSGDVTANGKTTGTSVTLTPSGGGQVMTVSAGGALTTTVDSSSPSATLLLDSSAEQTVAVFRLAANNTENLNVDSIKITDDADLGDDIVASYKFYNGSTLLGSVVPSSGVAEVFPATGALVIPANDYKLVTVKVVLNDIDGTGFVNGDTIITTIAATGDIDTTGLASGTAIDSTDTSVDAATHTVYEAYPKFQFSDAGVSTVLGANGNYLVGRLLITNMGNKDITFNATDDEQLKINFEISGTLTTIADAVVLKDSEGVTLDTVSMAAATGSTSATVIFTDNALTVSANGGTELVTIYVNTAGLTTDGNTIQAWLSDDAAGNLNFSIDGSATDYNEADFIFKGDIYGLSHVNPS